MTDTDMPTVEMLWESHDPLDVLANRFGFADVVSAREWIAATVERHWGLRVESCERIVMSFTNVLAWIRTPPGPMLVKWSIATGRFPRLAALADLVAWLHRQELPVSAPVAARDGRHQVEIDGVSMCLQREVAGDLLDVTDPDQLDDGGMVLARLHTALVSYPSAQRIPGLSAPSEPLAAQIVDWLDSSAAHVPAAACRTLRRLVTEVSSEPLPVQLIHGDFRSANIICAGQQVVAVLDFEEARLGHRVVDLARSAVLIGTRFHDWGPVTPEARAGLLDGYQSVCRLTRIEIAWWDALVLWFSLTMIPDGADPTGWRSAATVVSDNCRRTP